MAELRGGRDEPDGGDLPPSRYSADTGDGVDGVRLRAEPGSRAEYAGAMRQIVEQRPAGKRQTDQPESSHEEAGADPNEIGEGQLDAGQANEEPEDGDETNLGQADSGPEEADPGGVDDDADPADAYQAAGLSDRGALERFEPGRAGLPEVSLADAATYIDEHQADRPWLASARDCSPEAQRVIVALDQGQGHAHIRHEGWPTEEMNERRVRKLEDPAQLDQAKREARIDAFKAGDQLHRCGGIATRITDPEAFATGFARGVERPEVRVALDSSGPVPKPVNLPISDVLGDDGYMFCSGWRLEPVNGSMDQARANRNAWAAGDHSGPEPQVQPVETFEGGTVTFTFRPSIAGGHEVNTMYINPPENQPRRGGEVPSEPGILGAEPARTVRHPDRGGGDVLSSRGL